MLWPVNKTDHITSTLANECTIPVLQGWTPEEGLVAPGLQTLEVCGEALALLQLLWGEILIKAYLCGPESTGGLESSMLGM